MALPTATLGKKPQQHYAHNVVKSGGFFIENTKALPNVKHLTYAVINQDSFHKLLKDS